MAMTFTESEQGVIHAQGNEQEQMRRQVEALYQNLRTVRHAINNNVAVIMAMAELSQRNPAQSAKLSQLCLEKAPQIASAIGGFSELFEGAMSLNRNREEQD
jgi:ABC-type ATPase involved in cell division